MRFNPFRPLQQLLTAPRFLVICLLFSLSALLIGCSEGTYPVDIFTEMHYNESYKSQEPNRLDGPIGAVPVSMPKTTATGEELFVINCSMCHGFTGTGDGNVLSTMITKYGYTPKVDPDLTSDMVQNLPDVAILALISNGINVMPRFDKLLTEEEQLLILQYIRELQ